MEAAVVIEGLTAAIKLAQQLYADYQSGKAVVNATDLQTIRDQLAQAKALSDQFTPLVDASLDAAAKR